MADSAIEWTDAVWNPTTGCDKVSPGCGLERWPGDTPHGECYALTMAKRLKGMGQEKYQRDGDPRTSGPGFGLTVHPGALTIPLWWRKPRRIFVNSMSDLFHADVPDDFIANVFAVMAATPQHTYQILTKRHGRMRSLVGGDLYGPMLRQLAEWPIDTDGLVGPAGLRLRWPLPNVWLGVSVEDQKRADLRVPALLDTPAAVRWLSCEPLLGPVDLTRVQLVPPRPPHGPGVHLDALRGHAIESDDLLPTRVDWVVVGGESGPRARPMGPSWARSLRDQCAAADVPFFFKQWGEWMPADTTTPELRERAPEDFADGEYVCRVGKKPAGRELDGRTWDEYPEVRHAG